MSLRLKLLFIFIFLAVTPLILAGTISFQKAKDELIRETSDKLIAVADVQKKRIHEILDRYFEQIKSIASEAELGLNVAEYEKTSRSETIQAIDTLLQDLKKSAPLIDTASIRDQSGVIIASTDVGSIGRVDELTQYASNVRSIELNDVFKNKDNVLRIRLLGPIFRDNQNIGIVEVVMSADALVSVTEDYAGLGKTGEVILAKKNQAGDALFLTPLRFDSGAALSRAVSQEQTNSPVIVALSGKEVVATSGSIDYRGKPVFSVTRFIDPLRWGLVVKIDASEALASANTLLVVFFIIIIATALIAGVLSYFLSIFVTRPVLQLAKFADEIAAKKFTTTTTTTTTTRNDELGMLARALNTMASKIKASYITLEDRVKQRTVELTEKTREAESSKKATLNALNDLNEVKRQIEEKLHEVERLNKLMVGRELKMIDLKKELKELRDNK